MSVLIYERQYAQKVAKVLPKAPDLEHVIVIEDGTGKDIADALNHGHLTADAIEFDDAVANNPTERDFEERSDDDLYILYTGGTTGKPKGVVWRQYDVFRVLGGGTDWYTGEPVTGEWSSPTRARPAVSWCGSPSRRSSTADRSGRCSRRSSVGRRRSSTPSSVRTRRGRSSSGTRRTSCSSPGMPWAAP